MTDYSSTNILRENSYHYQILIPLPKIKKSLKISMIIGILAQKFNMAKWKKSSLKIRILARKFKVAKL